LRLTIHDSRFPRAAQIINRKLKPLQNSIFSVAAGVSRLISP